MDNLSTVSFSLVFVVLPFFPVLGPFGYCHLIAKNRAGSHSQRTGKVQRELRGVLPSRWTSDPPAADVRSLWRAGLRRDAQLHGRQGGQAQWLHASQPSGAVLVSSYSFRLLGWLPTQVAQQEQVALFFAKTAERARCECSLPDRL